jgi:hypothetical protein
VESFLDGAHRKVDRMARQIQLAIKFAVP